MVESLLPEPHNRESMDGPAVLDAGDARHSQVSSALLHQFAPAKLADFALLTH